MLTATAAQNLIRTLNQKVRDGLLDPKIAEKLAVLAMQEVAIADGEPEQELSPEPVAEEPAPDPPPAPAADPKTTILQAITYFETESASSFGKLKAVIEQVLMGTEGAAFPLGDFDVKSAGNSAKVKIEKGDSSDNVDVSFAFDRSWLVSGVKPPATVEAAAEEVCHLGLRKRLVASTDEVMEFSDGELPWERSSLPLDGLKKLFVEAKAVNDPKVMEIVRAAPSEADRELWRKWSIAAQAYLLGTDYSAGKSFEQVLKSCLHWHEPARLHQQGERGDHGPEDGGFVCKICEGSKPSRIDFEKAADGQKWLVPLLIKIAAYMDQHGRSEEDAIDELAGGLHDHYQTLLRVALSKLDL